MMLALQSHGFLINKEKSCLEPSQQLIHLEAKLDTVKGLVALSPECTNKIRAAASLLKSTKEIDIKHLSIILSLCISASQITPIAYNGFCFLINVLKLPPLVRLPMRWWAAESNIQNGIPIHDPENCDHHRCQFSGLGSSLSRSLCTEVLVTTKSEALDKLVGAKSYQVGDVSFCTSTMCCCTQTIPPQNHTFAGRVGQDRFLCKKNHCSSSTGGGGEEHP
ncbi:Hypothetical predicted protein [Podarcis lilfordi]|uniref:Uncharacterized protein n=1 Tax=Podarcis lilfordi TaxID=74358 RepID=A0AA35JWA5_9SAUR|nr:Hypothetical predicted protein [Podarcis lilfordi]